MTPQPSTSPSGVAWVVLEIREVPVRDQRGRPLRSRWDRRRPLTTTQETEVGTVHADCRQQALFRARQQFAHSRDTTITVQAAVSRAIGTDDAEVIRKTRIPPVENPIPRRNRRRAPHAKAVA